MTQNKWKARVISIREALERRNDKAREKKQESNKEVVDAFKSLLSEHGIDEFLIMACKDKDVFFLTGDYTTELILSAMIMNSEIYNALHRALVTGTEMKEGFFAHNTNIH